MTKNLWGDVPKATDIRTPLKIIQEQAALIAEHTGGLLRGQVQSGMNSDGKPTISFSLVVPGMNNYTYHLMTTNTDPATIYPVRLVFSHDGVWKQADTEEQFEKFVAEGLQSERTRKVLVGLQTQARSALEQKKGA